jgi:hypothetical protein
VSFGWRRHVVWYTYQHLVAKCCLYFQGRRQFWRWEHHNSPKRRHLHARLDGVTSQETVYFIASATITSRLSRMNELLLGPKVFVLLDSSAAGHALYSVCNVHRPFFPHNLSSFSPFLVVLVFLYFFFLIFPLTKRLSFLWPENVDSSGKVSGGCRVGILVWSQTKLTESFRSFCRAFLVKGIAPLNRPRSLFPQSSLICCGRYNCISIFVNLLKPSGNFTYDQV